MLVIILHTAGDTRRGIATRATRTADTTQANQRKKRRRKGIICHTTKIACVASQAYQLGLVNRTRCQVSLGGLLRFQQQGASHNLVEATNHPATRQVGDSLSQGDSLNRDIVRVMVAHQAPHLSQVGHRPSLGNPGMVNRSSQTITHTPAKATDTTMGVATIRVMAGVGKRLKYSVTQTHNSLPQVSSI